MHKKSKTFRNLIFFIVLIALTFYILLKDQDIMQILNVIRSVKVQFVIIGAVCMMLYIVCEAINIGRTLKILKEKSSFFKNIKYALIGFFFSSITPAASGGQPAQVYYMHKDKISVANSTLALLLNLTSMQIITISFALFSLIFNHQHLNQPLRVFFVIGILLNASALTLLLIGVFSRRLARGLVNIALKIMKLLRIKNIEAKKERYALELEKYHFSAVYIKDNKKMILKMICTTAIQFFLYYSVSYWTYRAFGLNEENILKIVGLQSILFGTVSGIPSPGAVGVTEGAFMEIFKSVIPEGLISSAVLVNRGVNFYLLVMVSAIVVIINDLVTKNDKDDEVIEEIKKENN